MFTRDFSEYPALYIFEVGVFIRLDPIPSIEMFYIELELVRSFIRVHIKA